MEKTHLGPEVCERPSILGGPRGSRIPPKKKTDSTNF